MVFFKFFVQIDISSFDRCIFLPMIDFRMQIFKGIFHSLHFGLLSVTRLSDAVGN